MPWPPSIADAPQHLRQTTPLLSSKTSVSKDDQKSNNRSKSKLNTTIYQSGDCSVSKKLKATIRWQAPISFLQNNHDNIENGRIYLSYYVPLFRWAPKYKRSFLGGDVVAALTVASVYIPVALSLASNLARIPAVNGLYGFIIIPLVYAIMGSSFHMVVGPEATGSLIVGMIVLKSINDSSSPTDAFESAKLAGLITAVAGILTFAAGLLRLGFLDNILSRPFLRGFVTAVGVIIFVDQLIPELGLGKIALDESQLIREGTWGKLIFLFKNIGQSHPLTSCISIASFITIMIAQYVRREYRTRYPRISLFPEQLFILTLLGVLAWALSWSDRGLELIGSPEQPPNDPKADVWFLWPFKTTNWEDINRVIAPSIYLSLLGIFESSVSARSLESGCTDGIQTGPFSTNRDLVALGAANMMSGCFMGLPGFGGYGRSKLSVMAGGKTPMVNVFLSLITSLCFLFLIPTFQWLPKAVLCVMNSVIATTLLADLPHDLMLFISLRAWSDIAVMTMVFLVSVFHSPSSGIGLGIIFSVIGIIRHATKCRVQVLEETLGLSSPFQNIIDQPDEVEHSPNCTVIRIAEPLMFTNIRDLENRLYRLQMLGSIEAHPASPPSMSPCCHLNVIFDMQGAGIVDASATASLLGIVKRYRANGMKVIFCNININSRVLGTLIKSGIVEACGGPEYVVRDLVTALRLAEEQGPDIPVIHNGQDSV